VLFSRGRFLALYQGILKGEVSLQLTSCLTGLELALWQLTIFVFICKRLIQIGQTGGQPYSETFPFSVSCLYAKIRLGLKNCRGQSRTGFAAPSAMKKKRFRYVHSRKSLERLMFKRKLEIDTKLLLHAIQRTSNFESLLSRCQCHKCFYWWRRLIWEVHRVIIKLLCSGLPPANLLVCLSLANLQNNLHDKSISIS
jgi:hypothetical protein